MAIGISARVALGTVPHGTPPRYLSSDDPVIMHTDQAIAKLKFLRKTASASSPERWCLVPPLYSFDVSYFHRAVGDLTFVSSSLKGSASPRCGSFLSTSGSSRSLNQRGLAGTGISPTI